MNGRCCAGGRPPRRRLALRLSTGAVALVPGAVLVLLPKCPLCIATWIAASTGVGVPFMVAGGIRPALIITCVLLAALLIRRA